MTIRIDGALAAFGRLTAGPKAVFEAWTRGRAGTPTGPDVIDLGRCLVGVDYRGFGLIESLCVESLLLAAELGFRQVVGAVRPERRLGSFLEQLGFAPVGPPVDAFEPNDTIVLIQPLMVFVEPNLERWRDERAAILARLKDKGVSATGETSWSQSCGDPP